MIKDLFSSKAFIAVSIAMGVASIALDALAWLKIIAKDEPALVVHLSTWALVFSAYGNIIAAMVNREVKKEEK